MSKQQKPLPVMRGDAQPFWEGCNRHELLLQRCQSCGAFQWFPKSICTKCASKHLEWVRATGKGEIYSFSVIHRPSDVSFVDDVPYAVAIVRLDEGVKMLTNIVGCPAETLGIGMKVEVVFEDRGDAVALPKFRPAQ